MWLLSESSYRLLFVFDVQNHQARGLMVCYGCALQALKLDIKCLISDAGKGGH